MLLYVLCRIGQGLNSQWDTQRSYTRNSYDALGDQNIMGEKMQHQFLF